MGGRIMVIDDQTLMRDAMAESLTRAGHEVEPFGSSRKALERLRAASFQVVVTDLRMPDPDGLAVLKVCLELDPAPAVIVVTAHGTVANAVEAMKLGAFDYLSKPFEPAELEVVVGKALGHARLVHEGRAWRTALQDRLGEPSLVGDGPAMRTLRAQLEKVAQSDATLFLVGESGTGKEVAARLAHHLSPRRRQPFLGVNCAALSAGLLESELFGHEKGAFTGAEAARQGRFELAAGGSLLLDEVTEMEERLQAKLLRVLQERLYERVGSSRTLKAEARVIATTNRVPEEAVRKGSLRQDLYYRLNVLCVRMPPLRERREDIPALAAHFLARAGRGRALHLAPEALVRLKDYGFPGNVRELENLIERAAVLADGSELGPELFPLTESPSAPAVGTGPETLTLEDSERRLIEATLRRFGGQRRRTAQVLGIAERTLRDKIARYGLKESPEGVSA